MKKSITIFSDGSSKGNPGPGGWGAIIASSDKVVEIGGGEKYTTNNRMELLAAISALETVENNKEEIILNTDSSYVINGITKWVFGWQKNNWKTSTKADVVNKDLWERLIGVSFDKKIKSNCGNDADIFFSSFPNCPFDPVTNILPPSPPIGGVF